MKQILLILGLVFLSAASAFGVSLEELKALEAKAREGDAATQVTLGDLYFAESLQLYIQAAEKGEPHAQYVLGRMYYNETNLNPFQIEHYFGSGREDELLAREWYVKAAEQGLVEAQLLLGKMSLGMDPGVRQYEEASKWFTLAAEQGSVEAQRSLGLMYSHLPQPQLPVETVQWLTRAAENGDAVSQFELAKVYLGQHGVPQDYAQAFKWFSAAAEQGEARALWELAKMYFSGYGVAADKVKALALIKQAADDPVMAAVIKSETSMRMFRDSLEQGLSQDERARAQTLYDEAVKAKTVLETGGVVSKTITMPVNVEDLAAKVKAGDAGAQFALAEYYSAEGFKWYQQAAEANNVEAQRKLGILYNGEGVIAPDEAKSLGWFARAADNGDAVSQRALGLKAAAGGMDTSAADGALAVKWLTLAADQGDAEAQYWLSMLYNGWGEIPADAELALKWETASAVQGHPRAQYHLGEYYSRQKNYDEASRWFTSAAEHDIPSIQYDVAHKYYVGKDGIAQDLAKAFQLFLKAAQEVSAGENANDPESGEYYYMVGDLYYNGHGTRQNYSEALKWFTRAADLGSGQAAYRIAEMHKNGQGVRKNIQTAIEWFAKAHDYYNKDAAYTIAQIYVKGDGVKPDMDEAQKWLVAAVKSGDEDALQWFGENPDKVGMRWIVELERTFSVHERDRDNLALVKALVYDMAEAGNAEALQRIFALAGGGDINARFALGQMYFEGRLLPQSYINAWVWGRLALDQNAKSDDKALESNIQQLMNAADVNMTDFEQSAAREDARLLKQAFQQS